jgi:GNAT superfamily N-acetyltransferase
MLVPTTELAARIEQAECRLVADCTRSAARRRPHVETLVQPIAGGVATFAGPGSPLDKLAGLGFQGAPRPPGQLAAELAAELAAIEQVFARHGSPLQVELSSLADPSIGRLLTTRGYVLMGFEDVLGRTLTPDEPHSAGLAAPTEIQISRSEPDELPLWLDTVVSGFATPDTQGVASHEDFPRDALAEAIGDMASAAGFVRHMARRHGQPAGGASLRMSEGVAQLCGAATLPAHRRRGVQTALLETRLAEAAKAGCDLAVVTTLPGSKSQHNVQRRGFSLLYTRAILVREPATGG